MSAEDYNIIFHTGYNEARWGLNLLFLPIPCERTRPVYHATWENAYRAGYNLAVMKAMDEFVRAVGGAEFMDKRWIDEI